MEKLTSNNTVILLVDHQIGTMGWVRSDDLERIKLHTTVLAKTAKALDIPVVLTSSMENAMQGPLCEELQSVLPEAYEKRILREGIINSWEDPKFAQAVRDTGRKNLVMAGITTDVCLLQPAICALKEGFNVIVIPDASGSPTKVSDDLALRRMENEGIILASTLSLLSELASDWSSEDGGKLIGLITQDYLPQILA